MAASMAAIPHQNAAPRADRQPITCSLRQLGLHLSGLLLLGGLDGSKLVLIRGRAVLARGRARGGDLLLGLLGLDRLLHREVLGLGLGGGSRLKLQLGEVLGRDQGGEGRALHVHHRLLALLGRRKPQRLPVAPKVANEGRLDVDEELERIVHPVALPIVVASHQVLVGRPCVVHLLLRSPIRPFLHRQSAVRAPEPEASSGEPGRRRGEALSRLPEQADRKGGGRRELDHLAQ
mmetsp:Transcript_28726/g.71165  ORF Transcript_28726/g.71165 Transcript_28726/m.71165 type:complete len:234 (+) Transcript_28726:243-944(+)